MLPTYHHLEINSIIISTTFGKNILYRQFILQMQFSLFNENLTKVQEKQYLR